MVWHFMCFIVSSSLDLLLHEDFLHSSAIQKGSVHCTVVASNLNRLLSTIFIIDNFGHSCWAIFICFSRLEVYINFALLKLFVKPDSLLLEARRSERSSKGHNQTIALLLIELAVVQLVNLLAYQRKTNDEFEPTSSNMLQHIATRWPNACNILRPTMLRYVAFACCDRLAGALV